MPIPSQNEFLLPFLQFLSDGQTYRRLQMLFKLAKHFNISNDQVLAKVAHLTSSLSVCGAS